MQTLSNTQYGGTIVQQLIVDSNAQKIRKVENYENSL